MYDDLPLTRFFFLATDPVCGRTSASRRRRGGCARGAGGRAAGCSRGWPTRSGSPSSRSRWSLDLALEHVVHGEGLQERAPERVQHAPLGLGGGGEERVLQHDVVSH